MNPAPDWQALSARVAHLEKQNRRFKVAGMAVCIAAAAVLLMGQAAPQRTAKTIEANEFVLKDSSGVKRASLNLDIGGPNLSLDDSRGMSRLEMGLYPGGSPTLRMFDPEHNVSVYLESTEDGTQLLLSDKNGFMASIGTTDLVTPHTGETHKTSAASVVLFDKDKNVIWKTP